MEGLIVLATLSSLFVLIGMASERSGGPVRLVMLSAIVLVTLWYVLY